MMRDNTIDIIRAAVDEAYNVGSRAALEEIANTCDEYPDMDASQVAAICRAFIQKIDGPAA